MSYTGTDEIMDMLYQETERLERKATEMLGEAGQIVIKAWQDVITERGHVETGDMRDSVRASAVKKSGEAYSCSIYPHGRDRKRQSNATKAFVLHYGTSRIKGDHFVDEAEARSSDEAMDAMEKAWERE